MMGKQWQIVNQTIVSQCQLTLSVNKSSYNTYQQGVDKMRQVYKNIW
jgi:hypothetical protein